MYQVQLPLEVHKRCKRVNDSRAFVTLCGFSFCRRNYPDGLLSSITLATHWKTRNKKQERVMKELIKKRHLSLSLAGWLAGSRRFVTQLDISGLVWPVVKKTVSCYRAVCNFKYNLPCGR